MSKSFLQQKYAVERLSTSQIAEVAFSSRSTIAKYLKLYGIGIRPYSEATALRAGQIPYGKRLKKGRLVNCRAELKLIHKIQRLRDKGYSYWKIAEALNDWGFATKNGGSRWHATTVMKILKASSRSSSLEENP